MASPTQAVRKTIGGRTYQLRPWGYEDGERWVLDLMRVAFSSMSVASRIAPPATNGVDLTPEQKLEMLQSMAELGSAILAGLTPEQFAAFRATCVKYTDLVTRDDEGVEELTQLVAAVHLKGRYADALELVGAHIEREYADFFGGLGDLLVRLFQGAEGKPPG